MTHSLPVIVEKDEDGIYVAECPTLSGCYSQGKTVDEALSNIQEVIALALEEPENQAALAQYQPQHIGFHTITVST